MMAWLSRLAAFLAFLDAIFIGALIVTGLPAEIEGYQLPLKNIRKPFLFFACFLTLAFLLHPERADRLRFWKERVLGVVAKPYAIWVLAAVYAVLFTWQQLTEYFTLEINFLPFEMYDYMLHYFFQGMWHYTGALHTYYHVNNILLFLAPLWYFFKTPLFLVGIYGLLAAAAIFPLYGIAKERFQEPLAPFVLAFVYLNYRYLQNVLLMNFSVEIFYPFFIFAALYCAFRNRWGLYYLMVLLGLMVKEDSVLYFSALGGLVFFLKRPAQQPRPHRMSGDVHTGEHFYVPARKIHGLCTIALSVFYLVFVLKIFLPLTGNPILKGDLENFEAYGRSFRELFSHFVGDPKEILVVMFGSLAKLRTYWNVTSRLLFLPFFSPACLFILAPVFPLFLHATGRDEDFVDLRFHYAAVVLPFVFIALIFGFSNLYRRIGDKRKEIFLWAACLALIVINGGHYVTRRITVEHIQSIQWARRVPLAANLVTHGHLLPYIGYRKYNYYFAVPFGLKEHPLNGAYSNADYYLIDMNVNPYPMDRSYLNGKVQELRANVEYLLVAEEGERYLFKRKGARP